MRVLALVKTGCRFPTKSNILFVCGGNEAHHLRPKSREYCNSIDEFLFFQPEYAIESLLSEDEEPFILSEFERLIGNLSLAIVVFPEAAGSCAEAGYFSAIGSLAKRTILVLDQRKLEKDSFLSIGPAKLISNATIYHPPVQFDYMHPDFDQIIARVRSKTGQPRTKGWQESSFNELSEFDKLTIICCLFDILRIAAISDVIFLLKGLYKGRVDTRKVVHITSVLLGSGIIKAQEEDLRYEWVGASRLGVNVRDGHRESKNSIRIEIVRLLSEAGWLGGELDDAA